MLKIEKALKNSKDAFSVKYQLMKTRLLNVEYEHWAAGFAYGNNHGRGHIQRVLQNLDRLVGEEPLQHVNAYELFLAMMAILYHDIGLLQDRKNHADISKALLEGDSNDAYIINPIDKEIIAAAVVSHSSSKDLAKEFSGFSPEEIIGSYKARPTVIGALVRLADELDEDHRRADPILQRRLELPAESQFFWLFCRRIRGIWPDLNTKRIDVNLALEPEDTRAYGKLPDGTTRHFVAFVAEKLAKINAERVVVNQYLPQALRYTGLHIDMKPVKNHPTWTSPRTFVFNDKTTAQMFLDAFPEILEQPASDSIAKILVQMHEGDLDGALRALDGLDSVAHDLPIRVQLNVSYEKACTYSLMAVRAKPGSKKRERAIDKSAEYIIKWFEQGQKIGWARIGRTVNAEVHRMANDPDLTGVVSARKALLEKTIPGAYWPGSKMEAGTKGVPKGARNWRGGGSGCIPRGTMVQTPRGSRPVESLRSGDKLVSLELNENCSVITTGISALTSSRSPECLRLNQHWLLTPTQPVRKPDGWLEARHIKVGDYVLNGRGEFVHVDHIETVEDYFEVYDISTDHPSHNYVANGLLVHNKKKMRYKF
jgi:HD domain